MRPTPDNSETFTARLRSQPAAGLPPHWRGEILAAAMAAAQPAGPSRWRRAAEAFGAWLWPNPLAYAGLLAVWVVIFAWWHTPSSRLPSPAGRTGILQANLGSIREFKPENANDVMIESSSVPERGSMARVVGRLRETSFEVGSLGLNYAVLDGASVTKHESFHLEMPTGPIQLDCGYGVYNRRYNSYPFSNFNFDDRF